MGGPSSRGRAGAADPGLTGTHRFACRPRQVKPLVSRTVAGRHADMPFTGRSAPGPCRRVGLQTSLFESSTETQVTNPLHRREPPRAGPVPSYREGMPRVLVADDDPTVQQVLFGYLSRAGLDTVTVDDGEQAVAEIRRQPFDLVLLDVMMGAPDGLTICRALRADPATARIPILLLTALGEELDRIAGLESGADDYVTKPFSPREVTLRVDSLLRRAGGQTASTGRLRSGCVEVDLSGRQAWLGGAPLALTARELDLLAFLLAHPGEVFSRGQLMRQVWGWSFGDESTVTVHVRRLREKIEADPSHPQLLATVWGSGYRWDAPHEP